MIGIISGLVLLLFAVLAFGLQRLYSSIPVHELKRLARRGDHLAKALYRPAAYGVSLRTLLWLVGIVASTSSVLLLLPHLPGVIGFLLIAAVLAVSLVLIPSIRLTVRTAEMAAWLAPALVWVLRHTHPVLAKVADFINRFRDLATHSLLYEKEDLQHLLATQKEQVDNRIQQHELEMVERALAFEDRQAADVAQSRSDQYLVNADDTIGPILLDQLHKSGQSSFLAYKDTKENIIGSLTMRDAVAAKHDGRVFDLIHNDLIYVHENFSLQQVLAAFQKTGHQLAIVVNSFEEFVGIITFDVLLGQLLGEPREDGIDSYENRSAVAAYKAKEEEKPVPEEKTEEQVADKAPSPEATEVVE
jgi:CBS domain containing-hemolysin-like protein